ncbi:xylan esterase [Mariniphaga sediminis]|uniref:Xylan esterase n=1 Tax=Mariniphaga sediminis TaxID=1628158 RepID=A0A399CY88_9BACT|nr:acetylxylan esterase [Mariniphaga sediminis]RIH63918.1 xylan esterase [Mariniphaga sediminis]
MKYLRTQVKIVLIFGCMFAPLYMYSQEENLKVFDGWVEWSNGENMLQLYLNRQAYQLLDKREQQITQLKNKQDWILRQQKVKSTLSAIVGAFPEKTPLNAKITGIIQEDEFRVEKIMYESIPGFYVSGCLFIPNSGTEKKPAILNVIGHSIQSFRRDVYQNVILNLVRKGFIVFAIDPIGQGERIQYYDLDTNGNVIGNSATHEHSFLANQCFLAGYSLAKYFIWDGIRAIDYLLSREEVDPDRIGLTGLSGGGTQTAFIAAFDERVKASAPSCYITSYRRLFESIGTQDGEQNFYHGLINGIDHADLLEIRAPKPTLIVSTTHDFFSIEGARETYKEVKEVYRAFGKQENITMSEADYTHGFARKNNEVTYAFFQKELENPGDPAEKDVKIFSQEKLNVTPTGQLSTSYKGKLVFDLIKSEAENLVKGLEQSRKNNPSHLETVKQKAKELSGFITPEQGNKHVFRGRYQRDGYAIEMYALERGENYVIPLLLAIPNDSKIHSPVIYIHPDGKEKDIAPGGNIEKLVKQGFVVAVPDLLGIGETRSSRGYPGSHGYGAMMIGRSIVGIQAGDIVRVVDFLKELPEIETVNIQAIAFGERCPALLHAAVFEPSITGIALVEAPVSYHNITQTKMYQYSLSFDWGVAGALTAYDLPDLAACIAPRKLTFIGILDGKKVPANKELIAGQMAFPEAIYANNNPDYLKIIPLPGEGVMQALTGWLKE